VTHAGSCPGFLSSAAAAASSARHAWHVPVTEQACYNVNQISPHLTCCSGAFKFRGAFNSVQQLSPEQAEKGVVTHRYVQLQHNTH
jgi:hypothetical protein